MSAQEARRKGLQEALAVLEALDKLEGAYERQGAAALTTGAERWAMRLIWSRGKQERRGASRIRQVIADVADNIKNKIFGVAKVLVIKYVALMESGKIKSPEDLAHRSPKRRRHSGPRTCGHRSGHRK